MTARIVVKTENLGEEKIHLLLRVLREVFQDVDVEVHVPPPPSTLKPREIVYVQVAPNEVGHLLTRVAGVPELQDFATRVAESVGGLDDPDTGLYRQTARNLAHRDGEIEIDHNAIVSVCDDGAYVQAWLWVGNEEVDQSNEEYEDAD